MEINYNLYLNYSFRFDELMAFNSPGKNGKTKQDPIPEKKQEDPVKAATPRSSDVEVVSGGQAIRISELIKISTAAERRGTSRQSMYYHVNSNHLRTVTIDDVIFVLKSEVDALDLIRKK